MGHFCPPGFGSTDPIESGSNPDPDTDPDPQPWWKYLNSLIGIRIRTHFDPGSGMGKIGSGINIPDPQHWLSGFVVWTIDPQREQRARVAGGAQVGGAARCWVRGPQAQKFWRESQGVLPSCKNQVSELHAELWIRIRIRIQHFKWIRIRIQSGSKVLMTKN